MLFDKFQNKYIVEGVLVAKMPIHIGKGQNDFDPLSVDNGVVKDKDGNPFIPGSSLKGVIRSYIERLFYGGIVLKDKKLNGCLIVNKPCLDDEKVKKIKEKYKGQKHQDVCDKMAKEIYDSLCDVCKLFGSNHFASKINISDAYLDGDKAHIDIRDGVAIDRDKLIAADNKKYNFECVSAGTRFKFKMTFDNLEQDQVEIAKLIVDLLKNGEIKVGGKTSAGLGDIQLTEYSVYRVDKDNLIDYLKQETEEKRRQKAFKEEW